MNPNCPSALVSASACYAERGGGFGSGFALTYRRRLSATTPLTLAEGAGRVSPSLSRRELAAHVVRSSPLQLPPRWSAVPQIRTRRAQHPHYSFIRRSSFTKIPLRTPSTFQQGILWRR